jgi:FlaA1/EpsC-like NDP-sugar epimerase
MFEELFYDAANAQQTRHPKILRAIGRREIEHFPEELGKLEQALIARDEQRARQILFDFIAESAPIAPQAELSAAPPALAQAAHPISGT